MVQLKSVPERGQMGEPENSPIFQGWLGLSLLITTLYAFLSIRQGFQAEFVIQDDARQHVFWMQHWLDPTLFPNDGMVRYFESVAPTGYAWLYRLMVSLGIPPLQFNKLVPIGLSVITTYYSYRVSLKLLPTPIAAFCSSLLLSQTLWERDDLISGTARAFVYPIFAAFLY
ncbi:MAG: hypothetical protein VKJ24_06290, partial [Synechococcales bacterium]|nr:hypothetical protein [Synechococcales bacterium]